MQYRAFEVRSASGVRIAGYSHGQAGGREVIVLVHGFPDDHSVWDGVAADLSRDHHVVTVDVRGCGRSDAPTGFRQYHLDLLIEDLVAVLDEVAPAAAVHLVGHDWGSVQLWHAIRSSQLAGRVASATSISGPCLDEVPGWIGSRLSQGSAGRRAVASMWKSPIYMGTLAIPGVGTVLCRSGFVDAVLRLVGRIEGGPGFRLPADARANMRSVHLYTNLVTRLLRPRVVDTDVPVLILTPTKDRFITPASQAPARTLSSAGVQITPIEGGHWVPVTQPTVVADHIRRFVALHDQRTNDLKDCLQ